jgi:ISXO2-like transposase domain
MEIDEAWIGGLDRDHLGGRHANSKSIIAVAAEERGRGLRRIRMRQIYATDGTSLLGFIEDVVALGSVVHTDSWMGYAGLGKRGPSMPGSGCGASGRPTSCCPGCTWWSPC